MKILAVCGFGVGSSMVLKMTIEKVVKDLSIEANVENTDLSTATSSNADVIFTSHELSEDIAAKVSVPVYPIKKYMDKNEVKKAMEDYIEKN